MSQQAAHVMTGHNLQNLLLAGVIAGSCSLVGYLVLVREPGTNPPAASMPSPLALADIPFDGQRAYGYLNELCALGPRPSGSAAMESQRKLLAEHFRGLGGDVRLQKFRVRHPQTGAAVPMANLIVTWHPERRERILLCAHYDTRPYPDRDPHRPRGTFVGANDGASGTAILMELAQQMKGLPGELGVDFALFDGEEFVFDDDDAYFIGSEFFASEYAHGQQPHRYRAAVLLDLVGDADLQIYPDRRTLSWSDSRPLVDQIWNTARRLGVSEFARNHSYDVLDDHVKLHDIGKIPSCDLIDFDYPYWHTEQDVPARCSALSLAKVGWVVQEWLKQAVAGG